MQYHIFFTFNIQSEISLVQNPTNLYKAAFTLKNQTEVTGFPSEFE